MNYAPTAASSRAPPSRQAPDPANNYPQTIRYPAFSGRISETGIGYPKKVCGIRQVVSTHNSSCVAHRNSPERTLNAVHVAPGPPDPLAPPQALGVLVGGARCPTTSQKYRVISRRARM